MFNQKEIILASSSPRRFELLSSLGFPIQVVSPNVDETELPSEKPEEMVQRLSRLKALTVAKQFPDNFIVAADTTVVFNGKSIGKPTSPEDAFAILSSLQNNQHSVFTGCTILNMAKNISETFLSETIVQFYPISSEEIIKYIESKEPMDKAGSYGAQGIGAQFIKSIVGSYSNVVGLDVGKFMQVWKNIKN